MDATSKENIVDILSLIPFRFFHIKSNQHNNILFSPKNTRISYHFYHILFLLSNTSKKKMFSYKIQFLIISH